MGISDRNKFFAMLYLDVIVMIESKTQKARR